MNKKTLTLTVLFFTIIFLIIGNLYQVLDFEIQEIVLSRFYIFLFTGVGIPTVFFLLIGIIIPAFLFVILAPIHKTEGRALFNGGWHDVKIDDGVDLEDSAYQNKVLPRIAIGGFPIVLIFMIFNNMLFLLFDYMNFEINYWIAGLLLVPSIFFGLRARKSDKSKRKFNGFSVGLIVAAIIIAIIQRTDFVSSTCYSIASTEYSNLVTFGQGIISSLGF